MLFTLASIITTASAGTLYFQPDYDPTLPNDLVEVDTTTCQMTPLLPSGTTAATTGLAAAGGCKLSGSRPWGLRNYDICAPSFVDTPPPHTDWEGLAYDDHTGILYGTTGSLFAQVSPATGGIVAGLPTPPTDLDGLTYIPDFCGSGIDYIVGFSDVTYQFYYFDIAAGSWFNPWAYAYALSPGQNPGMAWEKGSAGSVYIKMEGDVNLYSADLCAANQTVPTKKICAMADPRGGGLAYWW